MKNSIQPWKHFKLITIHKWYVFKNCCKIGMPLRGFLHDFSKYSWIEFGESMKYYSGNRSPIDNCKDINGISIAWLHHKGKNKHHWEYWIDNIDNGGEGHPVGMLMPYKYAAEMVCDYLAAGQAYNHGYLNLEKEWEWWENKRYHCVMHPAIKIFVTVILHLFKEKGEQRWKYYFNKRCFKDIYKRSIEEFNNGNLD